MIPHHDMQAENVKHHRHTHQMHRSHPCRRQASVPCSATGPIVRRSDRAPERPARLQDQARGLQRVQAVQLQALQLHLQAAARRLPRAAAHAARPRARAPVL